MKGRIRESAVSVDEVLAEVSHPSAGAVVTFLGTVRDQNDGHAVTRLEYEAYPSMAEKEMAAILEEVPSEIAGVRVAAIHRVGTLAVGDTAVVCAASSMHRDEAYRACRLLIDKIKSRVPIWKREHGPDGPYWVGWEDARCGGDHTSHSHGSTHDSG